MPIPRSQVRRADGEPVDGEPITFPEVLPVGKLIADFPNLRKPVIDGVLRLCETLNVISVSKNGKSWLVMGLALCIATGRKWLGRFNVTQSDVLVVDNELHPETISWRIRKVAAALGIDPEEYHPHVHVAPFRGQLRDIFELAGFFGQFEKGRFGVVICDALYRTFPESIDENSNAGITKIYNALDQYAEMLGSAIVCVHHSSKGSQAGKSITDVGSGGGAQSRATDSHMILRPHVETDAAVMECVCRSWPPVEPVVLRWNWPLWVPADDLDPTQLRQDKAGQSADSKVNELGRAILEALIHFPEGATETKLKSVTERSKYFGKAILSLLSSGDIVECEVPAPSRKTPYSGYKRVCRDDEF